MQVDLAVVPPAELLVVDGHPSKYPDSQTAKLLELIKKVCHHPDQPKLKICRFDVHINRLKCVM
jgi:hypothetical protein